MNEILHTVLLKLPLEKVKRNKSKDDEMLPTVLYPYIIVLNLFKSLGKTQFLLNERNVSRMCVSLVDVGFRVE